MSEERLETWRRVSVYAWTTIAVIAILAIFLYVVGLIRAAIPPFLYALILVYFLRPVVDFFDRLRFPRLLSVIVTYVFFIIIFSLLSFYLVPLFADQINAFIKNLPEYLDAVAKLFPNLARRYQNLGLPEGIDRIINKLAISAQEYGISLIGNLPETTSGLFGGLLNLILGPIIAFYFLKDLHIIRDTVLDLFPKHRRDEVTVVAKKVNFIVGSYLRGQALISLIVGLMIGIYLWIIGVKFASLLGLLGGVLNIVPYLGAIVAGGAAAIVAFFQAPILALWVIIGMIIIQQIESLFVSPHVMSKAVDLHPTLIIFSLLVGAVLLGFVGALLAIPVAAVAKALVLYYFYEGNDQPGIDLADAGNKT